MAINQYTIRRLLAFVVVLLILAGSYAQCSRSTPIHPLSESIVIDNNIRYEVEPLSISSSQPMTFNITLESYQRGEDIQGDINDHILLYDDQDNAYEPILWDETYFSSYKRVGTVSFPPLEEGAKVVTLSLFFSGEVEFPFTLNGEE